MAFSIRDKAGFTISFSLTVITSDILAEAHQPESQSKDTMEQ